MGAASTHSHRHHAITQIAHFHRHLAPGPQYPPLHLAHTGPPSSLPDLLLPRVHLWHGSWRGLSRTFPWLLTLLALSPTASASGPDPTSFLAFSGTPTHSHLRASPQRTQAWPLLPFLCPLRLPRPGFCYLSLMALNSFSCLTSIHTCLA